jgi:hypothetical protein
MVIKTFIFYLLWMLYLSQKMLVHILYTFFPAYTIVHYSRSLCSAGCQFDILKKNGAVLYCTLNVYCKTLDGELWEHFLLLPQEWILILLRGRVFNSLKSNATKVQLSNWHFRQKKFYYCILSYMRLIKYMLDAPSGVRCAYFPSDITTRLDRNYGLMRCTERHTYIGLIKSTNLSSVEHVWVEYDVAESI